jgi:hypothetical protein
MMKDLTIYTDGEPVKIFVNPAHRNSKHVHQGHSSQAVNQIEAPEASVAANGKGKPTVIYSPRDDHAYSHLRGTQLGRRQQEEAAGLNRVAVRPKDTGRTLLIDNGRRTSEMRSRDLEELENLERLRRGTHRVIVGSEGMRDRQRRLSLPWQDRDLSVESPSRSNAQVLRPSNSADNRADPSSIRVEAGLR